MQKKNTDSLEKTPIEQQTEKTESNSNMASENVEDKNVTNENMEAKNAKIENVEAKNLSGEITESDNVEVENEEIVDNEKELIYQRLVSLMDSISCMTNCTDKVEMYQKVAKQFSALSGYKDSRECAKACKKLAKKTNEKMIKKIYTMAQKKKNNAKRSEDFKSVAEEFRKASGYQDADDMALECEALSVSIEKKSAWKRLISIGVIVLCILTIIIGVTTPHAKYYLAKVYMKTNSYSSAINIYKKLDSFKDSKPRLKECQYRYGLVLKEEGDFKGAEKLFDEVGNYKDSEGQKVELEKLIIKDSKVGSTVKVGKYKWIILDIENDQVLLMKKEALTRKAYHVDFEDVTWEKSTLRQWLNSEFLAKTFSEVEQNNIILRNVENRENSVYGTNGGNITQDYIFLLSIDEVEKYASHFPAFNNSNWLRSPGNSQSSAAFLSVNGMVMNYGYEVTSDEMSVNPVLWFNIK